MELTWTTEKSEKETIKLWCWGWRKPNGLCAGIAIAYMVFLPLLALIGFLLILADLVDLFLADLVDPLLSVSDCAFTICFLLTLCIFAINLLQVRRIYRQRKTHKVEYRLTDDTLAFTVGETSFSSPWNKAAKKFLLRKQALYLYGKDLPFEAQCIPDWRGHGVEKKDLVAALKKAGLKKQLHLGLDDIGWFAGSLGIWVALFTIYFHIGGIEWGDWTIPNEEELRLEKRDVPDEDNAYIALMALTNLYKVADNGQATEKPDGDSLQEISDKGFVNYYGDPFNSEDSEKWAVVRRDPKRAERILAENTEFFAGFHDALSLKGFVDTDARREDAKRKSEDKFPLGVRCYTGPCVEFAQLVALRAQVALEKGDVESAVSDVGEIHALGQLLMVNNDAAFVAYLIGAMIEKLSFRKMCDVVAMGKASDEVVERFSKMVAVSEANASVIWERALKTEIARHVETVEWYCNHRTHLLSAMFSRNYRATILKDGNYPSPSFVYRILFDWTGFTKFACHRREMLYRQAMLHRAMLTGDDDLLEMISHEIPRNPFLPNCLGNLSFTFTPSFSVYARRDSLDRIRPRLVLAAEKWRRAHGGANPPTLDALVPEYLAAIPSDPWSKSGTPIKYDATHGVAWSVGKDGTYDYRKVAANLSSLGKDSQEECDTCNFAFRLDGRPISSTLGK